MGVGGERQAPAALPPVKRFGTHHAGGWVGPQNSPDRCRKSRPHQDLIPGPSLYQVDALCKMEMEVSPFVCLLTKLLPPMATQTV